MNFENKNIIQIIIILLLVAIVLLLGVQLDLNRRIALGDQYQRHHELIISNAKFNMQDETVMNRMIGSWEAGIRPRWWSSEFEENLPEFITIRDQQQRSFALLINLLDYDNQYYQYRLGLFDESYWQGTRESLKRTLRNPVYKAYFLEETRSAVFRDLVEELINENLQS